MDTEITKSEYPIVAESRVLYLNSAGMSVLPHTVEVAGQQAMHQKCEPWNGVGFASDIAAVRASFASIICCNDPHSIAITPSTGFGMSLVAKNVLATGRLKSGQSILLLEKEMGSAVYAWMECVKLVPGSRLCMVPDPVHNILQESPSPASPVEGQGSTRSVKTRQFASWTDAILPLIDETVAIVSLPAVHWCNGSLIDLQAVSDKIRSMPTASRPLLVIDGTQSIGVMPFDINALDADVVTCSVHKWLNCPYGMSLLYVKPSLQTLWQPLDQHERGRVGNDAPGWDQIIFMDKETGFYPETLYPDARRFDAGGKANPILIPMIKTGLQYTLNQFPNVGVIQQRLRLFTDTIAAELVRIFGPDSVLFWPSSMRCGHIMGIRFHPLAKLSKKRESTAGSSSTSSADSSAGSSSLFEAVPLPLLCSKLAENGVYCSVRGEWLRLAPYLHNSIEDAHKFVSIFTLTIASILGDRNGSNSSDDTTTGACIRVLITGGAGWLGQFITQALLPYVITQTPIGNNGNRLLRRCGQKVRLFVGYHTTVPDWIPLPYRVALDFTAAESAHSVIQQIRPDVILHTAAISSPGVCHKDVRRAYEVNCPTAFIEAIQKHAPDCQFVFTSTDMVYNGRVGEAPYRAPGVLPVPVPAVETRSAETITSSSTAEDAAAAPPPPAQSNPQPVPVNVYGQTKLACEQLVMRQLKNAVVLRLSNMIGPATARSVYNAGGGKFLEWLYTAWSQRQTVGLKKFEFRSFVYVQNVVDIILKLIERRVLVMMRANSAGVPGAGVAVEANTSKWGTAGDGVIDADVDVVPTRGIFNVGGPVSLSRLDLAESLCRVQKCTLVVHDTAEDCANKNETHHTPDSISPWRVYVMDTPPLLSSPTAAAGAPGGGGGAVDSSSSITTSAAATSTAGMTLPVTTLQVAEAPAELLSPQDISMDSTATEEAFRIKFDGIESILIPHCIPPSI